MGKLVILSVVQQTPSASVPSVSHSFGTTTGTAVPLLHKPCPDAIRKALHSSYRRFLKEAIQEPTNNYINTHVQCIVHAYTYAYFA